MRDNVSGASRLKLRLNSIKYAARDTLLFEFGREDGGVLPEGAAGAHIDVGLPNGLTRQYSLIHAEAEPTGYWIGVKRTPASRGGSAFLHENIRVGDLVDVSAPRNAFRLDESAQHVVLMAGGIGITPIWCMAQRLSVLGKSWELHYACRSRADAAFYGVLAKIGNVHFHFDDEHEGGRIDLTRIVRAAPAGSHFYCCGPEPMLEAYIAAAEGLPPDQVNLERFAVAASTPTDAEGFSIELTRSLRRLFVPPEKTILQVVREAGIIVESSCEVGVCGACETKVIKGIPDHRDSILSDEERASNKTMMICCSTSKGKSLVLDI